MSASILVPVYNALEYARSCIDSIYAASTSISFEVIVVDNGSSSDVGEWLASEQKQRANFRHVHFEEPLGFARAVNEGARLARHDRMVILNSDTLVTDGWLDSLAAVLESDERIGIVSPLTNNCGNPVQLQSLPDGREVVPEPQRLVFFCVMIRRVLWERLAGLDEVYGTGNFEDDDFCLRARMLGYRLAVARRAFVFHHERKTFEGNRLDHGEVLARNQLLFSERARRLATSPIPVVDAPHVEIDTTVLVPVLPHGQAGLRDSLMSLVNQTVRGFQVVVIAATDCSETVDEFKTLNVTGVIVSGADRLSVSLNAGVAETRGERVAFLPAGDVYYPFHLEALSSSFHEDVEAAYAAWSVVSRGRRGVVRFDQALPDRILLGDWAPLVCWMISRSADALAFDESYREFGGWALAMRLLQRAKTMFVQRVTCEKQAENLASGAAEARRLMESFPVSGVWAENQRAQFLKAVESGHWEEQLLINRNDVERRARRLLAGPPTLVVNARELQLAEARLREAADAGPSDANVSDQPDVFLFTILGWDHLTQRPHHFARGLALRGMRVFWIDVKLKEPELADSATLARRLEPNLFLVELPAAKGELYQLQWQPGVLSAMEAALGSIRSRFGIRSAIQLVNFPKWTPLVLRLRDQFEWPIVYDCLDDQKAFGELYRNNDAAFEEELAREAALLVTSGQTLFEAQRNRNPNTILIPNAADYELFHTALPAGLPDHLARPVIGFFGAFADWLDLDWIAAAAKRFPAWSFVYIGREGYSRAAARQKWWEATKADNIHVLPQVNPRTLASCLAQFDVCIMPFRDLPITRSMNAVKIYEYLAAGKPVVVPDLPEMRPFAELGLIATYRTTDESYELLNQAVATGNTSQSIAARRAFAAANTWDHRVDKLIAAIGELYPPACGE